MQLTHLTGTHHKGLAKLATGGPQQLSKVTKDMRAFFFENVKMQIPNLYSMFLTLIQDLNAFEKRGSSFLELWLRNTPRIKTICSNYTTYPGWNHVKVFLQSFPKMCGIWMDWTSSIQTYWTKGQEIHVVLADTQWRGGNGRNTIQNVHRHTHI